MQEALLAAGARKLVYPDSGPGPIVAVGNDDVAYFGEVSNAELFTAAEFLDQIPEYFGATVSEDTFPWLKFRYYGKYLFIKKKPNILSTTGAYLTSWQGLYDAGLIYGVDGPGPGTVAGNSRHQIRIVKKGNYSFKVRTITADETTNPTFPIGQGTDTTVRKSMYNQLIYRVCSEVIPNYTEKKFENYRWQDLTQGYEISREALKNASYPNGIVVARGNIPNALPRVAGYTFSTSITAVNPHYWRPVLELVSPDELFSLRDPGYVVEGIMKGAPSNVQASADFTSDGTNVSRLMNVSDESTNISYVAVINGNVENLGTDNPARLKEIRFLTAVPSYVNNVTATYTP